MTTGHDVFRVMLAEGLQLDELKADKSRRTVSLPRSAVDTLRAHRVRQDDEPRSAARGWRDSGLVFTTEIDTPVSRATCCGAASSSPSAPVSPAFTSTGRGTRRA
ncbi:hypothetical protein [Modestobacter marinus]|uniref:hypothetical protein n=1 Tax=Modestobacter marinus TaxID=477641 RepID=UPI001C98DAE0|nr:hypothetical protein [Modestobacter marinus]